MSEREISARAGTDEDAPSATVTFDFGDDLDGAVELFGADVVFSRFVSAATVDLQALIRRNLSGEEPKSEEEIQGIVSEWRPGVSTRKRKSAKEKAAEAIDALSDDERQALLDSLMAA
jgi:hypothetical protein